MRPALLDHAITFGPHHSSKARRSAHQRSANWISWRYSPAYRFNLVATGEGKFDAVLRAQELNGFGEGKVQALVRALRGIAFQEVTPEYDNLHGSAINIATLARWDPDKRRYEASISGPLWQLPQWRYWVSAGMRNENWDLRRGFTGPAPVLASAQSAQRRSSRLKSKD